MPMSPPCRGLKDKTLLVSSSGQATWWPWLKAQYQLSDAQVRPYTFNIQPFVVDDAVAQQAYVSSEVFQVQKAGVKANFFLFSEHGYPPTAASLSPARIPSPSVKRRWRSLCARLNGGLGELPQQSGAGKCVD